MTNDYYASKWTRDIKAEAVSRWEAASAFIGIPVWLGLLMSGIFGGCDEYLLHCFDVHNGKFTLLYTNMKKIRILRKLNKHVGRILESNLKYFPAQILCGGLDRIEQCAMCLLGW